MRRRLVVLAMILIALPGHAADADPRATMLRMQQTINQGVALAAQGANLLLQARDHSQAIDTAAEARGRELIGQGKALIIEAASGQTMMQLHSTTLTDAQSAQMMTIHRLERAALAYVEQLENQ